MTRTMKQKEIGKILMARVLNTKFYFSDQREYFPKHNAQSISCDCMYTHTQFDHHQHHISTSAAAIKKGKNEKTPDDIHKNAAKWCGRHIQMSIEHQLSGCVCVFVCALSCANREDHQFSLPRLKTHTHTYRTEWHTKQKKRNEKSKIFTLTLDLCCVSFSFWHE